MSVRRPGDLVALRRDVVRVLEPVRVRVGNPLVAFDGRERPDLLHAAGRFEVVQDRLVAREALEAHDLLGQEPSVLAEDDVTLARDVPAALVEGHAVPFLGVNEVLADGRGAGRRTRHRRVVPQTENPRSGFSVATIPKASASPPQ